MSKPFPLQTLLNLAEINNDSATQRLGQLIKQQHDTETQLETLQQYRIDYQQQLQSASQEAIDPMSLRNFQEFIYKLDAAILQQMRVVEQSKLAAHKGRSEFSDTQRKLKSFDTLQRRHIETQLKVEAKQ